MSGLSKDRSVGEIRGNQIADFLPQVLLFGRRIERHFFFIDEPPPRLQELAGYVAGFQVDAQLPIAIRDFKASVYHFAYEKAGGRGRAEAIHVAEFPP